MQTEASITRVECPTVADFQRNFVDRRQPVIITGAMRDWKALSVWSPEYFRDVAGDAQFAALEPVGEHRPGTTRFGADEQGFRAVPVTMREYVTALVEEGEPRYYAAAIHLRRALSVVANDLTPPPYITAAQPHTRIWFGRAGTISPLHYDASNNLHGIVVGSKKFTLIHWQHSAALYPRPILSRAPHFSRINMDAVDLRKFPRFRDIPRHEVTLAPGEFLYLPAGWWHEVETLATTIAVDFPTRGPRWGWQFLRLSPGRWLSQARRFARGMRSRRS